MNHPYPQAPVLEPERETATIVADPARRRTILIATCAALMAVVASASGLNVAQQQMAVDLSASQGSVLWIINAYTVALAALLLPAGAIADHRGRKPVLIAGLALFGAATAGAAVADAVGLMIALRILAGVGAAMVMPVTLSVLTSSFPEEARAQAIGVWTAVAGGGGLLGMLTSAVLVSAVGWRWVFALPLLLVVAAFLVTAAAVPNSRERVATRFDLAGSLLSVVGIGGLVVGIYEGPARSWTAPLTVASLAVGVFATLGFVLRELRCPAPLLDLRAFRDRRLAAGSTTLLVIFAVLGGVFVVLFPFFETVLEWSAIQAMAGLLPMLVAMMGASGLAPKVSAGLGARTTTLAGVAAAAIGLALMAALVSVDGGYFAVLPGMVLIGLGMGLAMPLATHAITASLPADRQGVASALNDTTRELGSALGIALLGAVLTASYRSAIAPDLTAFPGRVADAAREGIGRAFEVATREADAARADALIATARGAFVTGWSAAIWVGAAAMGLLLLFLIARAPRDAPDPDGSDSPASPEPTPSSGRVGPAPR
ncbi:MAG: MFS transporter [Actinobacteria bacterium]|nr:MFS transporter [Actinomycetota bacterium]